MKRILFKNLILLLLPTNKFWNILLHKEKMLPAWLLLDRLQLCIYYGFLNLAVEGGQRFITVEVNLLKADGKASINNQITSVLAIAVSISVWSD